MEFGDMLQELRQHAQHAVFDHRDQIHHALHAVGNVADKTTKGKYTDKIARAEEKANAAVDKFGGTPESNGAAATDADGGAGATMTETDGMAGSAAGETDGAAEAAANADGESSETPHSEDPDHEPPSVS
jgi:hypothetical protein